LEHGYDHVTGQITFGLDDDGTALELPSAIDKPGKDHVSGSVFVGKPNAKRVEGVS
jgi:hypothetical protein